MARLQARRWWVILLLASLLEAGHPPFRLFTTADGLVRNWIIQIRRDSKGHLWFCTVEGLSLFDGYRFTNFTTRDGLPSRLITDVLETRNGEYWIASTEGISRFLPVAQGSAQHFENFRIGSGKATNEVNALLEDSEGAIWCATAAGLYRLHPSAHQIAPEPVALDPSRVIEVSTLIEDKRQRIWVGAEDGLYVRSRDGRVDHFGQARGLKHDVNALALDKRGSLWAGGRGLTHLNLDAETPVVDAHYAEVEGRPLLVMALSPADNGDLWIGAHGLIRLRPDAAPAGRFRTFPSLAALSGLDIFSLAADAQGNLWAGISTLGAGRISREPSELFSDADGLQSASVFGLMEDRRGRFYAFTGATTHTLNEFTGDRFEARPLRPPAKHDAGWGQGSLGLQDRAGYWWFASGQGVLRYPPSDDARSLARTTPRVYTEHDGLPDRMILRLFEDSRGGIWVGTPVGVACWNRATDHWTSYVPAGTPLSPVHAIVEDKAGAIWVGFAKSGLQRIRGAEADHIVAGVPGGFINALLVDRRGRLWIGSSKGGLGRVDSPGDARPEIRSYAMEHGLSSDHVFALAEDSWGRIYVAGGRGVDRLDPETGAIRRLIESNGLPPGETERLYRGHDGAIWFASNFGLARYQPEPDQDTAPPAPSIRRLSILGVPYPISTFGERKIGDLKLPSRQNSIELEFRSVHFAAGEPPLYQYRLAGASEQWSAPDDDQTVEFANLSPGSYRFEVRSVGANGFTSAPAAVEFQLLPPFWRRSWFVLMAAAMAAASAYAVHRYRLNQLLAMERVRTRLATDLHDDLGAGLAEIAILSEVARRKPAGESEVLEHVAERARGLRAALSDIVWTVDPRRDRLSDLVHRMRQTALGMLERENRRVEFLAPPEEQLRNTELTPDLRRHLWLFFKESVTNAARHSGATDVSVDLALAGRQLRLTIRDNGCGFDAGAPAGGQGLVSLRYRAAEMRGELHLNSAAGRGTDIELLVPLPT